MAPPYDGWLGGRLVSAEGAGVDAEGPAAVATAGAGAIDGPRIASRSRMAR